MSIQIKELEESADAVEIRVSGKLSAAEYREQLPTLERKITDSGKLRVLAVMDDFHGMEFGAIWEDLKFDLRHYNDFERIAIVGDRAWETWLTVVCQPFTMAALKHFSNADYEKARKWLFEDDLSGPGVEAAMVTPL